MINSWSKEDLANFDKSEVFKELEKIIIDTVKRAEILQDKIAEWTPDDRAATLNMSPSETGQYVAGKGDSPAADDLFDEASDEVAEDALAEDLQGEVIDDLRDLVEAALKESNIKLAYRIERTIDEILEQDVVCE
jgi:hypothetical protein